VPRPLQTGSGIDSSRAANFCLNHRCTSQLYFIVAPAPAA